MLNAFSGFYIELFGQVVAQVQGALCVKYTAPVFDQQLVIESPTDHQLGVITRAARLQAKVLNTERAGHIIANERAAFDTKCQCGGCQQVRLLIRGFVDVASEHNEGQNRVIAFVRGFCK